MTAAVILARAESAGVTLQAAGDRLLLSAPAPPPLALLRDLACVKADLLDLLQCRADEAAEREAIQGEPELPPRGSKERIGLEIKQRAVVAGLIAAARGTRID